MQTIYYNIQDLKRKGADTYKFTSYGNGFADRRHDTIIMGDDSVQDTIEFKDDYDIEERMMLNGYIKPGEDSTMRSPALNDIIIRSLVVIK